MTRNEAERIARSHMAEHRPHFFELKFTVRTVEEAGGPGMYAYGLASSEEEYKRMLADSWLVYVTEARPFALKSSHLVIVSRVDGSITYSGSAYDEA